MADVDFRKQSRYDHRYLNLKHPDRFEAVCSLVKHAKTAKLEATKSKLEASRVKPEMLDSRSAEASHAPPMIANSNGQEKLLLLHAERDMEEEIAQ